MKIKNLYIILISFVLFSCSDNLDLKENDLKKYPWLTPFVQSNIKDFEGKHNMDLGTLEFSFQESSQSNALSKFDTIAQKEQWKVIKKSPSEREFSKVVSENFKEGETVIKVYLDTVNHRLHFQVD